MLAAKGAEMMQMALEASDAQVSGDRCPRLSVFMADPITEDATRTA